MKALLCKAFGPPESLVLEDIPVPEPGPGQVRIAVQACVLNPNDLLKIRGEHHERPQPPFSPSGEVAGVVSAVGPGVTRFQVGDAVCAMLEGAIGGMAEQAIASVALTALRPADMDLGLAATLQSGHGTAYDALVHAARMQHTDTVLILGAGTGVGLCGVEIAHALGATVIAVASTEQKLENARRAGADHTLNHTEVGWGDPFRDAVRRLTGSRGVDVVLDPVAGDAFRSAFRCLAWDGRVAVTGFTSRDMVEMRTILLLLKGVHLCGANLYQTAHHAPARFEALCAQLFRWHAQGRIASRVTHRFALDRVPEAMHLIARRDFTGKVVIHVAP